MATRKTSQAQHETPAHLFAAVPGADAWRAMVEAQAERFEQLVGELAKLDEERHARTMRAIDDVTRLVKSSVDYQAQLSTQWRELGVEVAKKSMSAMQAKAEA